MVNKAFCKAAKWNCLPKQEAYHLIIKEVLKNRKNVLDIRYQSNHKNNKHRFRTQLYKCVCICRAEVMNSSRLDLYTLHYDVKFLDECKEIERNLNDLRTIQKQLMQFTRNFRQSKMHGQEPKLGSKEYQTQMLAILHHNNCCVTLLKINKILMSALPLRIKQMYLTSLH